MGAFFFLAALLVGLSSPTRDRTWALGSESAESQPLDRQGIPLGAILNSEITHQKKGKKKKAEIVALHSLQKRTLFYSMSWNKKAECSLARLQLGPRSTCNSKTVPCSVNVGK